LRANPFSAPPRTFHEKRRAPWFSRVCTKRGLVGEAYEARLARIPDCVLCLPHLGVLIHTARYAAPDRPISVVVRACRNVCSAVVSGDDCAAPRLLRSQGSSPVSWLRVWSAHDWQYVLLQPRLWPRRRHVPLGACAVAVKAGRPAQPRYSYRRIDFESSGHDTLRVTVHSRSSASLHRLTYPPNHSHSCCG